MTKQPINITVKQGSSAAKVFEAAFQQKDAFRRAVEEITAARNINTRSRSVSNPYNILDHSTAYSFRNEEGINYICQFSDVTNHYAPILGGYDIRLIDFSFYPEKTTKSLDFGTGKTICELIKSKFEDTKNVITYVCDENDGRQQLRQFKFQKWCDRHLPEYNLQPIKITLETEDGQYYRCAGILTHPDFPHDEEIDQYLLSKVEGIVAEKNGI